MVRRKYLALFALTTLSALSIAHAESLIINNIVAPSNSAQTARPQRGLSMDTVESKWGQPVTKRGAIGDPPIARWEYSTFIVYFEYRNVIHAVSKR